MNLADAADYAEAKFKCSMGYPSAYVGPNRLPYVTIGFKCVLFDNHAHGAQEMAEHLLVAALIAYFDLLFYKTKSKRPALYWRHIDKIRLHREDGVYYARARLAIEGVDDYGTALVNDREKPYLMLMVDNDPHPVPLLEFKEQTA